MSFCRCLEKGPGVSDSFPDIWFFLSGKLLSVGSSGSVLINKLVLFVQQGPHLDIVELHVAVLCEEEEAVSFYAAHPVYYGLSSSFTFAMAKSAAVCVWPLDSFASLPSDTLPNCTRSLAGSKRSSRPF